MIPPLTVTNDDGLKMLDDALTYVYGKILMNRRIPNGTYSGVNQRKVVASSCSIHELLMQLLVYIIRSFYKKEEFSMKHVCIFYNKYFQAKER
jgi:hypothetical protein